MVRMRELVELGGCHVCIGSGDAVIGEVGGEVFRRAFEHRWCCELHLRWL